MLSKINVKYTAKVSKGFLSEDIKLSIIKIIIKAQLVLGYSRIFQYYLRILLVNFYKSAEY